MEMNEDLKAAKDVIQALLKSKKMIRMYPSNNPIYVKTLEDTYGRFRDYFDYRDDLLLKIRQNDIMWENEQVYYNPDKEDNLALFLFKDGLRELIFKKGLTTEEMEEFLKITAMDFDREVLDDDIVTLLWEKDFQNIQHTADDVILADDENYEVDAVGHIEEVTNDPDNILKAYQDAVKEDEALHDMTIVPLSDKDLQQLMQELETDKHDKSKKLVDILFELMYLAESRNDFDDLSVYFMNAVEFSMTQGDIPMVTSILSRLQNVLNDANVDEEIKKYFRKITSFAGSDSIIKLLGEILDAGQELEDKIIEDLVLHLDKNAVAPLMNILGELKSIHARKVVIDALIYIGPKDIMTLSKGLSDSRWYVVRNIIYILRKISDKRAVEFLLKTVRHSDIRVRKEVIRALGELGGGGVFQTLRECLDDPEIQVRSAALRALGTVASEAAKRIIMDRINDKTFRDKDFEEKKEYFEVISHWRDKEVFAFLSDILKKKSFFFGSAKNDEARACAAYGLGLLGNTDAISLLQKFKGENSKLIREFSYTAIKRLEHGQ
ncbi:MAG: HEAT repeat domain-containing protein [Nitrospirae bacterium]|nr:HEAT repeat domain-containing protein [Nitrospirota bacterium]